MIQGLPSPIELYSDRLVLMREGASVYEHWMKDIAIQGALSIVEEPNSLTALATRLTDYKLPTFYNTVTSIRDQICEKAFELDIVILETLHLLTISRGIQIIEQLELEQQWQCITAAGVPIYKRDLEKYRPLLKMHCTILSVEIQKDVSVPYQKTWFYDGNNTYFELEFAFRGSFKQTYHIGENYYLSFYKYMDFSEHRISIIKKEKSTNTLKFNDIAQLEDSYEDAISKLKKNPFIIELPIISWVYNISNNVISNKNGDINIPYYCARLESNEILQLCREGILFGEYKRGVICPKTFIFGQEIIPLLGF